MSFVFPDLSGAIEAGMQAWADAVLDASNQKVPVATGELRDSGSAQADGDSAAVGYSDSKAVPAHENTNDHIRNGRSAKFLELALHETQDTGVLNVAVHLRSAFS